MEVFHFIDHLGRGTIHQLLYPLERWSNHHVYSLDSTSSIISLFESIQGAPCNRLVLHVTGGGGCSITKHIMEKKRDLDNVFIFLHTSLAYQHFKKRDSFIDQLKVLTDKCHVKILTPSKACASQFKNIGIPASSVQLGIPQLPEECFEHKQILEPYYGKILTTCASSNPDYVYVKGIDTFSEMVSSINQERNSLIAGSEIPQHPDIQSRNFSQIEFLNILCHSLAYVQLSRFESYNITAIQAKQLKIPVFLVDVEGTRECMSGYVFDKAGVKEQLIKKIEGHSTEDMIYRLYQDSINRENIFSFKQSVEENVSAQIFM